MNEQLQDLLVERYELNEKIGQGGQGMTHSAVDRQTGDKVVVKELRVEHLDDWKAVELFEREGEALQALNHRAIPTYIDHFHIDAEGSTRLFLVQENVEGIDLARAIDEGLRLTEDEAIDFIGEVLEILQYIHSLSPPTIHRDIKPANIIRRPDASLALVDFGAVHRVLEDTTGGSTVVGTSGYMPLEQLMGRALPATDLYALGATTIHLLSHKHPANIDVVEMKLQFHDDIAVSKGLVDFLDTLVEPHVEDRYQSAEEAFAALRRLRESGGDGSKWQEDGEGSGEEPQRKRGAPAPLTEAPEGGGEAIGGMLGSALEGMAKSAQDKVASNLAWAQGFFAGQSFSRPQGSLWTDIERDGARVLSRPPRGPAEASTEFFVLFIGFGIVAINMLLIVFGDAWGFASSGNPMVGWFIIAIFGIGGLLGFYRAARKAWGIEEFELGDESIIHRTKLFGRTKTESIPLDSVEDVGMSWRTRTSNNNGSRRRVTYYHFVIDTGFNEHCFGEEMSKDEKLWAASAIRDHVDARR